MASKDEKEQILLYKCATVEIQEILKFADPYVVVIHQTINELEQNQESVSVEFMEAIEEVKK